MPSSSCASILASLPWWTAAPSSAAARERTGSSPICVTKIRFEGLISSTLSLTKRKYQSSSFPPRLSTAMIAPFWTNSSSATRSISGSSPTAR
jgi:hypothetical protein